MKLIFSTTIPIKAIPKGRPRVTRSGHAFTPKRTRDFEALVKAYLKMNYRYPVQDGPIRVTLDFMFQRPKKPSREYPSVGDLDNFVKGVCDAANQILYSDDSQIVELSASKCWSPVDAIGLSLWAVGVEE